MTLVVACRFQKGAVILADSRATWLAGGVESSVEDTLQKILVVGPHAALAYAGNVSVAACVVDELRRRGEFGPNKVVLGKMSVDLPRIAKRCLSQSRHKHSAIDCAVDLVFTGVDGTGRVAVWHLSAPKFELTEVDHDFIAVGSGSQAVTGYLRANFATIDQLPDLKSQADHLIRRLESELRRAEIETVGGLFQVITVNRDGIRPMSYGFAGLDPEGPPRSRSMRAVAGSWVQRVESSGTEVPLSEPGALIRRAPSRIVVQDLLELPEIERRGKWFLSYFIPCLQATRDEGLISFGQPFTSLAVRTYPAEVEMLAAVGFWGSQGEGEFVVTLEQPGGATTLYEERITVPAVELKDVLVPVRLSVHKPGPAFLECHFAGQLLGRRALYFGSLPPSLDFKSPAVEQVIRGVQEQMQRSHDPYIDAHPVALAYWTICSESKADPTLLCFHHEPQAVYWMNYPLAFRTSLAAGFRAQPGTRTLRVDLVHAASRTVTPVTTATVVSESSMSLVQVHSELIVTIPGPGWYFLNLHCDGALIGSAMLCAETSAAAFSYSLLPEDIARVKAGELLVLPRRAPSLAEALQASPGGR
jgi:20S proteasome alpha/beta subunit